MDDLKILSCEEIEGKVCDSVTAQEAIELYPTLEKMVNYCAERGGGGLAGPQLGIYKNFFVFMKREGNFYTAFNPKYYPIGKKIKVIENCFSCIEDSYMMNRYKEIQAVFYVLEKDQLIRRGIPLKGVAAVIFQHEFSHLRGETIQFHGTKVKKNE